MQSSFEKGASFRSYTLLTYACLFQLVQENLKVHNFSFGTESYCEYAHSSSKYRMPTMFSTKGDQLDHMLHVRGKTMHMRFAIQTEPNYLSLCGYEKLF